MGDGTGQLLQGGNDHVIRVSDDAIASLLDCVGSGVGAPRRTEI